MASQYREFTITTLEQLKAWGYKFISTHEALSLKDVGFEAGTEFSHYLVTPYKAPMDDEAGLVSIDHPTATTIANGIDLVYYWVETELLEEKSNS